MARSLASKLTELSPEDLAIYEAYRQAVLRSGISSRVFSGKCRGRLDPEGSGASTLGNHLGAARRFLREWSLQGWAKLTPDEQLAILTKPHSSSYPIGLRAFVCWLALTGRLSLTPELLSRLDEQYPRAVWWLEHGRLAWPELLDRVVSAARKLGYSRDTALQVFASVAKACAYLRKPPEALTQNDLIALSDAIRERRAKWRAEKNQPIRGREHQPLSPWTTGSVLYHAGLFPESPDTHLIGRRDGRGIEETQLGFLRHRWPAHHGVATRYLAQRRSMVSLSSVKQETAALGSFFRWLTHNHPEVTDLRQLERGKHIEPYLRWVLEEGGPGRVTGQARWTVSTCYGRLDCLQRFFRMLTFWGWPEAPTKPLLLPGDLPALPDPLPRAFDDVDAARMVQLARASSNPLEALIIELFADCGLRASEARNLRVSDVVTFGGSTGQPNSQTWLHVPLGKLRNDRYVPISPELKLALDTFLAGERSSREWEGLTPPPEWTAYILARKGRRVSRAYCNQVVRRVAERAGVVDGHSHRWRHTFATQAINHGMDLAAIATLLGHVSLEMTMVYARIANPKLRQEFERVSQQVQAFYAAVAKDSSGSNSPVALPAGALGPAMVVARRELEWRRLGNGWCTRRAYLDCRHELVCERCVHFNTDWLFLSVLKAQHEDAVTKGQQARTAVFAKLVASLNAADQRCDVDASVNRPRSDGGPCSSPNPSSKGELA